MRVISLLAPLLFALACAASDEGSRADVILLGATGNLAEKYLWQALYNIHTDGLSTGDRMFVWPAATKKASDSQPVLDTILANNITGRDDASKQGFLDRVSDYTQLRSDENYEALGKVLAAASEGEQEAGRFIYMSVPPKFFGSIAKNIHKYLRPKTGWLRVIVEKPFGVDLQSAEALASDLYDSLKPEEVLLVDHYMGKETIHGMREYVQEKSMAERVKTLGAIDHVVVGMLETDDCKGRTGFYDEVGVLRDTVQNHLMMMLAVMAMDTTDPTVAEPEARKAVFAALETASFDKVMKLAQYRDYTDHVNEDRAKWNEAPLATLSSTPTYAHIALTVTTPTSFLHTVPLHFKSGKAQDLRRSYVDVIFKNGGTLIFNLQGPSPYGGLSGAFILSSTNLGDFTPPTGWTTEKLEVGYVAKAPKGPFAYEFLLRAGLEGRKENFVRLDEVLEAWRVWSPVLGEGAGPLEVYDHFASLHIEGTQYAHDGPQGRVEL